jgi:organic radical activating enzyme
MSKKFPIAETFDSIQGEGLWTGTRMFFIRFAGCSVGKRMTPEERQRFSDGNALPVYREACRTWDGRVFACDTNFQTKDALTMEELLEKIPKDVERVCLTGGEPLNQPLGSLLEYLGQETNKKVHVETSGTVSLESVYSNYTWQDNSGDENNGSWLWISVSPKSGFLSEMVGIANEIKLLVDEDFDLTKVPKVILDHTLVWLQPVNDEFAIRQDNVRKCIELMKEHPNFRISSQCHKLWQVR